MLFHTRVYRGAAPHSQCTQAQLQDGRLLVGYIEEAPSLCAH